VGEGRVWSVRFHPDGKTLAAGFGTKDNKGGVILWDTASGKRLLDSSFTVKEGQVTSVCFSPDGKTLAAGFGTKDNKGGVILWDTASGKRLLDSPCTVEEGQVTSVCFHPDGKTLAASFVGVAGGGVILWDVARRNLLFTHALRVKEGGVGSVRFSPDGNTLAAGISSGTGGIVLWQLGAHQASGIAPPERLTSSPLRYGHGTVRSVDFSPNNKTLAAGHYSIDRSKGGGVSLWDLDPASWERRAAAIANRNFTREEWELYFPGEPYRLTFPELPADGLSP
jgi:WD40 repeat protein